MAGLLVLASRSPRRRALLEQWGFSLQVAAAEIDELESTHLSVRELTIANATGKAQAVQRQWSKAIVLAADTLVALDSEVIGKPRDLKQARAILRRLSGHVHEVCTAVFIAAPNGRFVSFAEISRVRFRRLSAAGIEDYLRKIDPLDKAGAYAAQASGSKIIESVEGSFSNVVGLPMERTVEALAGFGIRPQRVSTGTSSR